MTGWNKAQEAHDEEHEAEAAETVQIQGSSPDSDAHQEPGAEDADHVHAVLAEGEAVRTG